MNDTEAMHPYCEDWNLTFDATFHFGNVFLGLGYVMPQIFKLSQLALRGLLTLGFILLLCWSLYVICALDIFLYSSAFFFTNCCYLLYLGKKHFPVFIPAHQKELFTKVFQPFRVSRKQFHCLMRDCSIETVRAGKSFAVENVTDIGGKLRILLNGKLAVKCDEIFLHFIHPMEFVDSVEWRAKKEENPPKIFQVTMDAVYDCKILAMPTSMLEKTFLEDPSMRFVIKCLVGKDIARKLYVMNENVYHFSKDHHRRPTSHPTQALDFHRTNSADAISTGCRGYVRSQHWLESSALKDANDGDQLMVLNFELDVPPPLSYLPHNVPVHSVDRSTMAEAQFIAQQRKYWPTGVL